jgi:hypothetical protein
VVRKEAGETLRDAYSSTMLLRCIIANTPYNILNQMSQILL